MSTVKEKEKNILILSMSTLHPNMELSHYYGEGVNGDYRFDGVSQLEAGTKYLLHHLADKGQKIHRIIVLNTCQTHGEDATKWDVTRLAPYLHEAESLNAAGFYEKRIREYLQFGDKFVDPEMFLRDAGVDEELAISIRDYLASVTNDFLNVKYSKAKEKIDGVKEEVLNAKFKKYAEERDRIIKEECISALDRYANEEVIKNYEIQVANAAVAKEKERKAIATYIKEYIYTFLNAEDYFKHKKADNRKALELLYPQVPAELFKHIFVEYKNADGKYVKDATTVKMLCDDLLELKGTAESLHVYIDSQGGERTFIHTVNAAIDLLSNRNVTVKEIIATDFSRDKLINKVRFVTKDYAITDLGAGMKAFLRYGKAEELLSYLDKKGLGESANEKRMIDIIRGIGESLQIADPAGLNEYLGELQNNPELLSPESYSDTNFRIIVEDIKREYDRLLAPDGNLTDIIEWLYKKGFTVQALTFIEDKIPDYIFHEMKCISVKHSYATEVDAVNENGWSGGYETRIANAVVKNASGRLVQEGKKEYLSAVKNLILNRCISENWNRQEKRTKYISEWTELIKTQDRIKPYIKYVPLKELFDAYNSYRKLGTTYYMACQHGRMKQYEKIEEIMALPEKVLSTGTGNIHAFYKSLLFEKDEDLRKDDENLYSVYLKKIRTYLCGDSFLLDDKNKEIVVDLICSHIYRPELEKIYNNNVEKSKIDSAYEHMVLLESEDDNKIQMVVDSSERDYCMLMEALIEKYCFYCNHKTTVVKDYTFDNDLHARQSELFAKLLNEDLDDEDLYKNYIEYRNITYMIEYRREKTKQTEVFDNVEFYFRQIGGEMEELYHEKSYLICEDGYLYQTIAGLKESTSLPTIKLEEICIRKDVDKRLLEKILLLHGAISKERNNTNHASEKSVRLPLCVLERVIKLYLNWIRTL